MAGIDELKFSIILDDSKFTKKMEEVNTAAERFEKSVKNALAVTNLLDAAQSKGEKSVEQKAKSAEKSAAAAKKEADETRKLEGEEEKVYKLVELRQKRKEQSGALTKDEVQALNQMESIEKALLNVREQHKGKLAEEFSIMMNEEGMTKQQLGSYRSLVTQMQAATSETAKREAAEKAALTLREQKDSAILALERTMAGVDLEILSTDTQIAVQKGLSGQLTAKEIASLRTIIATEKQRYASQQKNSSEAMAKDSALIGLRQKLIGINQEILSVVTRQKIAKAEAGQLTSKEINLLSSQIALEAKKASEMQRQRATAEQLSSALTRQTSLMRGLTSYVTQYVSVFGAATLLRNLVRITGEFEAQHTALRAILQDTVAADNIFNQLQVLAVKSPYTFQDLVSYAKQLTAFSVPVNEVYETTKKLADVSAGLGVDMGRIILAYGQIRSASFLRGQEVRQLTESGIPILSELAKQFEEMEGHAISVGEVFDRISARQVPFAMVEEAFERMTSAGGKFYNMQEVLAETVKGKVANLQDAWEIMLSKIGDEHSGTINGLVTMMTNMFSNYERWLNLLSAVVKGVGAYAAVLAVLNGVTKTANGLQALNNTYLMLKNKQITFANALIPANNALQKVAIANNVKEAATLAALTTARKTALGIFGALVGVVSLVMRYQKRLNAENEAASRAMDELTRSYRENLTLFAEGWNDVEKAYKKIADERHNAYQRALEENKGLLPDISEATRKLIEDSNKAVGSVESIRRKVEGGIISGGELEAAVVTTSGSLLKLSSTLVDNAHSLKEAHLAGESVKGTQVDIEKQFSASKKTTEEYKAALDDLYKKFPNFIDENVRQKIAVEDLAGAWDAATQNMKQYYAENASHQAREILRKDYKENANKIVEDLNAELRTGRKFKPYRRNGVINEGSIQLIDAYVMGLKTEEDLSDDTRQLVDLLNKVGKKLQLSDAGEQLTVGGDIIKNARDRYSADTQSFLKAVEASDDAIERDFTSTRHRQVREYLLNDGISEDSELMMRDGADSFESWESWQERLRKMYEKAGDENRDAIQKMFDYFGLVVNPNGLTSTQQSVSDWMKENPAPEGVAMYGFDVTPETDIAEFAEKALKQMQDDAKSLARLPKEFQKADEQSWDEYAEALEGMGEKTYAMIARRVQYFEQMSQGIWGDNVFGSTKELLKQEKAKNQEWAEFRRDKIADLKQQFQDLKELKNAYDQFKGLGFNDNQVGGLLTKFFGTGIPKSGFGSAFDSLAKEMDKYSRNDAQDIRNYIAGKDWKEYSKSVEDAQKATAKFLESLEDLAASTKRLNLEGFAADLDKIIVDADSKNRKLQTDWKQKLDDLSESKDGWILQFKVEHPDGDAEKAWTDFYAAQKKAIDELIQTQVEYNKTVAQGQIDKKAESWMKEMMEKNNIDLSNMGDKSLSQVNVLIERMRALVSDEAFSKLLPPELKQDAELINASFGTLLSNVKRIANTKLGDLRVEKMKKTVDGVKALMSTLGISVDTSAVSESYSTLSQKLTEVANAQEDVAKAQEKHNAAKQSGDLDKEAQTYAALAMAIGECKSATDAATKAQGDFTATLAVTSVGAFASGLGKIGSALKKIGEASENTGLASFGDAISRVTESLNAAVSGYIAAYAAGMGTSSWIGAAAGGLLNVIGQITEAIESHQQMLTENKNKLDDYKVAYQSTLLEMAEFTDMFGEQVSRSAREAYDKMIAAAAKVREYYSELKGAKVITDHVGFWESNGGDKTQWKYLAELYPGLFDENGHINTTLASKVVSEMPTGGSSRDWNAEVRDMLQAAIDAEEAWKEAKEALDDYIASFTGDLASQLSDALWDAVASGADAWDEWHDVASEAISSIGKQMLTEMIQTTWLKKYEKALEEAFASGESPDVIWKNVAEIVEQMFGDVDSNYDKFKEITEWWQNEQKKRGYSVTSSDSDSGSLGNGIKSITEDTANLLASYLNAIRADVSYGRIQWERITGAVEGQTQLCITLNDYLAKVQADTANIAMSNQKIFDRLDGFVRDFSMASDYGESLKVQIVN